MNSLPDLSGFTDKKILIVDDNDINIMLNKIFLKNAGINKENIFIAIDGFEALELAQQELFDVIVMDIHMPGMSGTEATQKIREKYGTTHTPKIIAYTGDRTIGSIIEDKTIFDDFMLKPIKIEQFVGKIFDVFMSCIPQEK